MIILTIFANSLMGKDVTIWDPLRKKEVALTPEERVRQWCIGILSEKMAVPLHMMMSEAGFKLGDKRFRADILVYDRNARPLMVVECKRPEVEITRNVLDQAIRYNMALDVRYIMITNGTRTFICRKGDAGFVFTDNVPTYNEMLCHQQ
ncbi:MAG: type I restriction enzyme HsdR N-terminal domain-containing protein [Bacteroidales bacterium]|nr:type I restriction enzyme HsdR N-terminal domain-containing protein [Bacteroidales bacterium]